MNAKNPKGYRPHTFASLRQNPVHFLAFGLGSGLIHPAPGTWGTLAATLLYYPLSFLLTGFIATAVFLLATFAIGCWLCDKTSRDLGVHDFGEIVWDEFVGAWIVLAYLPSALWQRWGTLPCYLAAFLLFRLFDITKPAPIRTIDSQWQNATGVLLDDLLAAAYTVIVMAVWERLFD